MRKIVTGTTLIAALGALAPATGARAPKPPLFTTATAAVEFRDGPGGRVTSDGTTTYIDGTPRGLEVRMWINGSQDLTIGTFMSGRKLNFSYTPASVINGPAPEGSLEDNSFVNSRNIAAMPLGPKITKASFNTAIGYFRWLASPTPAGGSLQSESFDSQAVVVQRTGDGTWEVYTPADPVPFWDEASQTEYLAGDLSVLLKDGGRGTLTPVGVLEGVHTS
jgi:hypothetical protein